MLYQSLCFTLYGFFFASANLIVTTQENIQKELFASFSAFHMPIILPELYFLYLTKDLESRFNKIAAFILDIAFCALRETNTCMSQSEKFKECKVCSFCKLTQVRQLLVLWLQVMHFNLENMRKHMLQLFKMKMKNGI